MGEATELGPHGSPQRANLRFGGGSRLCKRREFLEVYERGRKARGRFVTIFCLKRTEEKVQAPFRLGLTATRRSGNAVRRNRQRRRVREFFRVHQQSIPDGWDFVVNTAPGLDHIPHLRAREDLMRCMKRLGFDIAG